MAACCTKTAADVYYAYGNQRPMYRLLSPGGELATLFNVDDPRSYYNWLLELGKFDPASCKPVKSSKPAPRFRELIDQEMNMLAFELTGNHDGSVYMQCPPRNDQILEEEFPFLNFVMTDLGGYASVEVAIITADPPDEVGNCKMIQRTIVAKNFRSRTCIGETIIEMPMRLKPSWNYVGLNLRQLAKDAWDAIYLATTMIKINANARVRRIYFSTRLFSYKDLPNEFQMNLNLSEKNLEELKDYEITLRPTIGNPNDSISTKPQFKKKEKSDNLIKSEFLQQANKKSSGQSIEKRVRNSSGAGRKQADRIRGLKLSVPSNDQTLEELMFRSVLNSDGEQTIIWKYPPKRNRCKLTSSVTAAEKSEAGQPPPPPEDAIDAKEVGAEIMANFPKDPETKKAQEFCAYIAKQPEEDEKGEWEKIKNFNLKPQDLAKLQRQRRGEGLYDIYTGKMIRNKTGGRKEFFGFGDNDQEAKFLLKKGRESALPDFDDDNMLTVVNPKNLFKNSLIERGSDLNFLKSAESKMNNITTTGDSIKLPKEEKCPKVDDLEYTNDSDQQSDSNNNICLLKWTYDEGLNWKQTRMINETKEPEIDGCTCEECRCLCAPKLPEVISDQALLVKSKKPGGFPASNWNESVIPPKAMIKPVANDDQINSWADAFYHVCFDSKILPFPK